MADIQEIKEPEDLLKVAEEGTKGRVLLLHAQPHQNCMVYIMRLDGDIFMYHAIINGQLYFSYIEGKLPEGRTEFTDKEIQAYVGIILAAAHATVENITGTANKEEQELGKRVIDAGEAAWYGDGKKKGGVVN